jgi:hypothetical protein
MEEFRAVKGYEGLYEVSNIGRLKSLARKDTLGRKLKEKILLESIAGGGYLSVSLCTDRVKKTHQVHQLVAIAFLGHKPNGHELVVNHIDYNKLNNKLDNLEVVSQRENSNQKHLNSTSKYVGVSWAAQNNKWVSHIYINSRLKYLGYFTDELQAAEAYQSALRELV